MQQNSNTSDLQSILDSLNPAQREATLRTEGPELVIAGAGSGKTKVLTTRIALLMEKGVDPSRILALTFTKKAAEEMRTRICTLEGESAKRLQMGTFHSVFISLMRPFASRLGFPYNFTILDEEDSLNMVKRSIRTVLFPNLTQDAWEQMTKAEKDRVKETEDKYKAKTIKNRISLAKNDLITVERYRKTPGLINRDNKSQTPLTADIYEEYRNACFRSRAMDFDDILLYMDILLENNPDVRQQIEAMFDYILVDEYQDTNVAQNSVLRHLTQNNKNICVVGDDSQSIYGFRGARIENIFNFKKEYAGCAVVRLEQNYRSTRIIVNAANCLISNNEMRIEKTCFSNGEKGSPIEYRELKNETSEAEFIAGAIIADTRKDNRKFSDFAVLYRTNSQSRAIEDAFVKRGIPYVVYSGVSFFERKEIKDMMAYFRLAVNPNDDESFRRVANIPSRGLGKSALEKLSVFARTNRMSLWEAATSPFVGMAGLTKNASAGLYQFVQTIDGFFNLAQTLSASTVVNRISDETGIYASYMAENDRESLDRADNIRELVDSVKSFEQEAMQDGKNMTLAAYIENAMLLTNADTESEDGNAVSLMTVHCAKGLEFDTVFIAGVEENLFPMNIDHTPFEREEERRLFYVAITRAKRHLILTKADSRFKFGKRTPTKESVFKVELLDTIYEN